MKRYAIGKSRDFWKHAKREMKCILARGEKIKLCRMGREEILRRKSSQFRKHLIMCFKLKHMLQYFLTDSLCASSKAACWAGALQWSFTSCLKWYKSMASLREMSFPFPMSLALLFHHLSSAGMSTGVSCTVSSISNALAMHTGGHEWERREQNWLFQHLQLSWTQAEDACPTTLYVSSFTPFLLL